MKYGSFKYGTQKYGINVQPIQQSSRKGFSMIANGVDVSEYGFTVVAPPPIQSPTKRTEKIRVPGRSGYLTQWDGSYDSLTKNVELMYNGANPAYAAQKLQEIETVTFSNEPDKEYLCEIPAGFDLAWVVSQHYRFVLPLVCDPLKREVYPQEITATSPVNIVNPGNFEAYPTITITGIGTVVLTVGTQTITLTDISPSITIDGELKNCYQTVNANLKMTGDFPKIEANEALTLSWTGTVTGVQILPNWRWI